MKKTKKKLIADIILVLSVLLISALCYIIASFNQSEGSEVVVTVGNEEYGRFPLNIDKKLTITVDDETNLQYNVLVIENGSADIIEASCPDGICEDHLPISKSGETIVCLPNKVVVRIESDKDGVDIAA
ncbi:MAG: NusG domain II-containing protein [Ruminococcaceae bacterium]|nr:NusG domain II-containing protein [Oscillospiraceae bacterium]